MPSTIADMKRLEEGNNITNFEMFKSRHTGKLSIPRITKTIKRKIEQAGRPNQPARITSLEPKVIFLNPKRNS